MPNGRDALTWVIGQATASAVGGVSQDSASHDSGDSTSESAAGASPASNGADREMATDRKEAWRTWAS